MTGYGVKRTAMLAVVIGLTACAPETATSDNIVPALPASHASVIEAIKAGQAAQQQGNDTARDDAARRLIALKARPLEGTTNLAQLWRAPGDSLPPMRGRVQGPGYRVADLARGQTDQFQEIFYGIEETHVSVSGDGDYMIDILDEDGRQPLCDGEQVCRFVPDVTARYQVRIRNQGEAGTYIFVVD